MRVTWTTIKILVPTKRNPQSWKANSEKLLLKMMKPRTKKKMIKRVCLKVATPMRMMKKTKLKMLESFLLIQHMENGIYSTLVLVSLA